MNGFLIRRTEVIYLNETPLTADPFIYHRVQIWASLQQALLAAEHLHFNRALITLIAFMHFNQSILIAKFSCKIAAKKKKGHIWLK